MQSNGSANFPRGLSATPAYVNCYVWKPSNATKYGTILDGDTGNIADSASSGTPVTNLKVYQVTFTGAAVSSLTSGDAVIVFEAWFRITQSAATSFTQAFGYDGPTVHAAADTSVTDEAAYIETPENLSINDGYTEVKLYLHNTTSGLPTGTLPNAEQSTKTVTAACNFEGSQTTNRLMNTTIGASQASLALATPASVSASTFYVSRWVSPMLSQTSVAAGTWTYNFAAAESNTSANFPVTASNKAVWINCYVWKPSNATKYGTILDGNTTATVTEGTAAQERSQQADFTGSAVASLTSGDACIVLEVWFAITQGAATSYTDTFYYDGTTETAGGSTVSNHASYIMTNGIALSFGAPTNFDRPLTAETITISEVSLVRLYGANRAPTAETNTIGEAIARVFVGTRALSAETNTIGETLTRLKAAMRAPTAETNTIGESLARLYGANRALSDTTVISESLARLLSSIRVLSDTTVISESIARLLGSIRALSADTTAISESIARMFVGTRALSVETNTIGESLARLKAATRAVSDTTTIGESLVRVLGAIRSLSDITAISESLVRVYNAMRALSDTTVISETLTKIQTLVRSLSDTIIISESLARLLAAIRSLSDTSIISEAVDRVIGVAGIAYEKALSDTIAISESLARVITNVRSLADTTAISEALTRLIVVVRALTQTTTISESLTRLAGLTKSLTDTTTISDSLNRAYGVVRTLTDTTTIGDSLSKLIGLTKSLTENTIISESLDRLQVLTRTLADTTIISDSLATLFATGTIIRDLVETVIISEVLERTQTLTRTLTENIIIIGILEVFKGVRIPLYLQPTAGKRPEGVGERNRSMERDSPLYLKKQLALLASMFMKRKNSLGRFRHSLG